MWEEQVAEAFVLCWAEVILRMVLIIYVQQSVAPRACAGGKRGRCGDARRGRSSGARRPQKKTKKKTKKKKQSVTSKRVATRVKTAEKMTTNSKSLVSEQATSRRGL